MAKIALDNGHGFETPGKRTPPFPGTNQVIREWQFNHPTTRKLKEFLEQAGHEVLMVSDTAEDTPLMERVRKANAWGADIFVSVHFNAYNGIWGTHGGIETLYYENSNQGKELAMYVQNGLIKATGLKDRGIVPRPASGKGRIAVLADTKMPAILTECGFMDNLEEAKLMLDVEYQTKCAKAIATGINKYLGITTVKQNEGEISFTLLGKEITTEGVTNKGITYINCNGTLIPLRKFFETLGLEVIWDEKQKQIKVKGRK